MIQIYVPGNENFQQNGDAVLFCFSCDLKAELNGTWVLTLDAPLDDEGRWKLITEEAVVKVPTWQVNDQLYRIAKVTKTDDAINAIAYPIFYDSSNDCFLMDVRPTGKTGQEALNIMTADSPYSGESNISTAETAYFVRRNLLSAINGNESPTFIERWGGEILYDNYKVIINDRVGGDYGVEARYGRNIEGVTYVVDTSNIITRIIPVAYNGHTMSGDEPWVDSPNLNSYAKIYTKEVHYENIRMVADAADGRDDIIICDDQTELDAALEAAAEADFANGCDTPIITLDVDMAITSDYKHLETVRLGDTIRCRHYKLNITSTSRVISIIWDCIRQKVVHVTLGDFQSDYVQIVNSTVQRVNATIREDGSIVAEMVKGYIDGSRAQFHTQYNLAERQDVMAILFENLDSTSPMYGALGIGTQGICISKTRTADGRDWDWTTGITANGMNAGMGIFGIISDRQGNNYWNLDTGVFYSGSINTVISQREDEIMLVVNGKVGNDEIISKINQSAEAISISASKINLNGAVSANNYFKINLDGSFETIRGKIGNIVIDQNAVYTDGKTAASSTVAGFYLGSDGSFVLGDSTSYLKFLQTNNAWDLSMAVSSLTISGVAAATTTDTADAAKVATNYLYYTAANGLVISNTGTANGDADNPFNTQLTASAINFRNRSKILMSLSGTGMVINRGLTENAAVALTTTGMSFYRTNGTDLAMSLSDNYLTFYGSGSNAGVAMATIGVDGLDVKQGKIGAFAVSSTSNTGTTAAGGHVYTSSLYSHAASGNYEYEYGLRGGNTNSNIVLYVAQITNGASWSSPTYITSLKMDGTFTTTKASIGSWTVEDNKIYANKITLEAGTANTGALISLGNFSKGTNTGRTTAYINSYGDVSGNTAGFTTLVCGDSMNSTLTDHPSWMSFLATKEKTTVYKLLVVGDTYTYNTTAGVVLNYQHPVYASGTPLGTGSDGITIAKVSSSSRRYKNIDRVLTGEDIEAAYNIGVYRAKYKKGYLMKGDRLEGKYMPMFIAEEVEKAIPEAAIYNKEGIIEDWNYRVIIPVMFQMIKDLKKSLKEAKKG